MTAKLVRSTGEDFEWHVVDIRGVSDGGVASELLRTAVSVELSDFSAPPPLR